MAITAPVACPRAAAAVNCSVPVAGRWQQRRPVRHLVSSSDNWRQNTAPPPTTHPLRASRDGGATLGLSLWRGAAPGSSRGLSCGAVISSAACVTSAASTPPSSASGWLHGAARNRTARPPPRPISQSARLLTRPSHAVPVPSHPSQVDGGAWLAGGTLGSIYCRPMVPAICSNCQTGASVYGWPCRQVAGGACRPTWHTAGPHRSSRMCRIVSTQPSCLALPPPPRADRRDPVITAPMTAYLRGF